MIENKIFPAEKPSDPQPHFPTSLRPRILVADDEPLICQLHKDIFAEDGYEVEVVADGAAAWDALQLGGYDLLVTDNQMPKLSGVDLVMKIRSTGMSLPVIMATGTPPEDQFIGHVWLQPFVLMLKPYSIMELSGAANSILHRVNVGHNFAMPVSNL